MTASAPRRWPPRWPSLRETIAAGLEGAETEAVYELRYRGQAFELAIDGPPEPDPAELAERFAAEHERRYGYRDPDGEIELVTIRVALVVGGPEPRLEAGGGGELERSRRRARFGGEWAEAEVLRGEPAPGTEASGPCIFELPEATLVASTTMEGDGRRGRDHRGSAGGDQLSRRLAGAGAVAAIAALAALARRAGERRGRRAAHRRRPGRARRGVPVDGLADRRRR